MLAGQSYGLNEEIIAETEAYFRTICSKTTVNEKSIESLDGFYYSTCQTVLCNPFNDWQKLWDVEHSKLYEASYNSQANAAQLFGRPGDSSQLATTTKQKQRPQLIERSHEFRSRNRAHAFRTGECARTHSKTMAAGISLSCRERALAIAAAIPPVTRARARTHAHTHAQPTICT